MRSILLPGLLGLLTGLTLRWSGLWQPRGLRDALALRRRHVCRSGLYALGAATAMTALLCYLAVIDVDEIVVLPLSAGALAGGAVFGVCAALAGYTPLTAFTGLGGLRLDALCTIAGCFAGTLLLPLLEQPLAALRALPPHVNATLFQVTLDESYLLGGGFLAQGCAGLLLAVIAMCIPSHRAARVEPIMAPPARPTAAPLRMPTRYRQLRLPAPDRVPRLPAPADPAPDPDASAEDTFVAILPGEEPLVVDTAQEDE